MVDRTLGTKLPLNLHAGFKACLHTESKSPVAEILDFLQHECFHLTFYCLRTERRKRLGRRQPPAWPSHGRCGLAGAGSCAAARTAGCVQRGPCLPIAVSREEEDFPLVGWSARTPKKQGKGQLTGNLRTMRTNDLSRGRAPRMC